MRLFLIAYAICATLLTPAHLAHADNILEAFQRAQEAVIEEARKAVVTIHAKPRILAAKQGLFGAGTGSGNILGEGYILTNRHVVDPQGSLPTGLAPGNDKLLFDYTIQFFDGASAPARLIHISDYTDLAILRVDAQVKTARSVRKNDSRALKAGDIVFAIGAPLGLDQTVTTGIISNPARDGLAHGFKTHSLVQTDAAINRGNSGGPLVNIYGEVVGINTMILSSTGSSIGLGFAIPAPVAWEYANAVLSGGNVSGYLGVSVIPLDESIRPYLIGFGSLPKDPTSDLYVNKVEPGWEKYFKINDVIVSIEGRIIKDPKDFERAVAGYGASAKIMLKVWRDGAIRDVAVLLQKRPGE